VCGGDESSNLKDWSNITQRCKLFNTNSTFTKIALLPWRYDTELNTATRYTLRRNTASIR